VYAGPGRDHLYGGPGVDRFFLNDDGDDTVHLLTGHTGTAADAAKPDTRDVIDNFDPAQDHIDLSAMDASPNVEGDQAFTWIGYAGSGSSQGKPLQMGQVGWFYNYEPGSDDIGVAWVTAGGRQALVLEDLAAQAGQLDASDFWL
jgi:hypothetical protein